MCLLWNSYNNFWEKNKFFSFLSTLHSLLSIYILLSAIFIRLCIVCACVTTVLLFFFCSILFIIILLLYIAWHWCVRVVGCLCECESYIILCRTVLLPLFARSFVHSFAYMRYIFYNTALWVYFARAIYVLFSISISIYFVYKFFFHSSVYFKFLCRMRWLCVVVCVRILKLLLS